MNTGTSRNLLTRTERIGRAALVLAFFFALIGVRSFEPQAIAGWLPLHASCGRITGLPCIFCGTTRAIHFLLNGAPGRALYYNWLAFPLVAGAIAAIFICTVELLTRRKLLPALPKIDFTPRSLAAMTTALVLLWFFQIYLAVAGHKSELLNPNGYLYSLVVH